MKPTKEENLKSIADNHKRNFNMEQRANDNTPGMQKSTTTSLENIKLKVNGAIQRYLQRIRN